MIMLAEPKDVTRVLPHLVKLQFVVALGAILITIGATLKISSMFEKSEKLKAQVSQLRAEVVAKEAQIRDLEKARKTALEETQLIAARLARSREAAEYIRAGINHYQRGEYVKSVQSYRTALEMDPTNPVVYDWMGYALYCNRQYAEAEQALRRSVELDPTYARGYYNLALVLWKLGDQEGALSAVRKAVTLMPAIKSDLITDKQFRPFRDVPEFRQLITSG
jgi:tetratricopeptide (TPR) repeat protein